MDKRPNTVQPEDAASPVVVDAALVSITVEEAPKAPAKKAKKKFVAPVYVPSDEARFDVDFHRLINETLGLTDGASIEAKWDQIIERGVNARRKDNLRPILRDRIFLDCPFFDKALNFRVQIGMRLSTQEARLELHRRMNAAKSETDWIHIANFLMDFGKNNLIVGEHIDHFSRGCHSEDLKGHFSQQLGEERVNETVLLTRAKYNGSSENGSTLESVLPDGGKKRAEAEARRAANRAERNRDRPAKSPKSGGGNNGQSKGKGKGKKGKGKK